MRAHIAKTQLGSKVHGIFVAYRGVDSRNLFFAAIRGIIKSRGDCYECRQFI